MLKAKVKVPDPSAEVRAEIIREARAVWQNIAGDCFRAFAEDGQRDYVMPRSEVIEVVVDYMNPDKFTLPTRAWWKLAYTTPDLDKVLTEAFPHTRYSM